MRSINKLTLRSSDVQRDDLLSDVYLGVYDQRMIDKFAFNMFLSILGECNAYDITGANNIDLMIVAQMARLKEYMSTIQNQR